MKFEGQGHRSKFKVTGGEPFLFEVTYACRITRWHNKRHFAELVGTTSSEGFPINLNS